MPDKDLPATLQPRLTPPSDSTVRGWFNKTRWFVPSEKEISEFSFFLRSMTVHATVENWNRKNGFEVHDDWQKAVQVLRDALPNVIRQNQAIEQELGFEPSPENRSAELARLLIAARETYIGTAVGSDSIHDSKNDHAASIARYITGMAERAGAQSKDGHHRNSPLAKITASAMEICGFAGAVSAEALAADFKLKGLDPKRRRGPPTNGKKS